MKDNINENLENFKSIEPYSELFRSKVECHPDFFDIINANKELNLSKFNNLGADKIKEKTLKIFEKVDSYTDLHSPTFQNMSCARQQIKQLFLPQLFASIDKRLNKKIDLNSNIVTSDTILKLDLEKSAYDTGYDDEGKNQIMNMLFNKIKAKLANPNYQNAANMFEEYYINRTKEHFHPLFKGEKPVNFYYKGDEEFSESSGFITKYTDSDTNEEYTIKYHSVRLSDILNIMGQKESSLMYFDMALQMGKYDENKNEFLDDLYQSKLDQFVDHIANYMMIAKAFFTKTISTPDDRQ